ncbi:hypothetical protein [Luteolibacter algae]|uniref:hypothetical protein n=1 Tax=Luteolibacter algae TaxID=454151 RepID=UPI0036D885AC
MVSSVMAVSCAGSVQGQVDFWDLPPINYSDTAPSDRLARLSANLPDSLLQQSSTLELLKLLLEELEIPVESQVLVFSKTSLQNGLIHPRNPRSLYFSENAYVGYVPGGDIEVIVEDAVLGPVYYLVRSNTKGLVIERDTSNCLSCHGTGRTEGVPGMLIRSVFPDSDGHPLLHLGTEDTTHESPIEERWGGWYVTGNSSLPHLGNRVYTSEGSTKPEMQELDDLRSVIDVSKYPRPTSDIVALMVLEHQCRMHTLLNAASMNYRRTHYFSQSLDPTADPNEGPAGRVAESWAEKIVECMFFKNEADLEDGAEGDPAFQRAFVSRFPKTSDGETLAEFRLYGRIFKNRCSYMVYSDAFRGLPLAVKALVLGKMKKIVANDDPDFDWISGSELRRIDSILSETLPEWNR